MNNEESVLIKLADGTEITAKVNGNNYLPVEKVDPEKITDENMLGMTINDIECQNMTCCNNWIDEEGQQHIIFRQYSDEELRHQEVIAKLQYIAAMEGIEL